MQLQAGCHCVAKYFVDPQNLKLERSVSTIEGPHCSTKSPGGCVGPKCQGLETTLCISGWINVVFHFVKLLVGYS